LNKGLLSSSKKPEPTTSAKIGIVNHYDHIIFDFDGTLADSFAWFWRVLPEVTAKFRLRAIDATQRDKFREMPAREIMAHMGVRWWQAPGIAQYARWRMDEDIDTIAVFDGVREMLATLRRAGVRLAVVSSNSEANVRRVLGAETSAHIEHFGCGAPILGKKGRTAARCARRTRRRNARFASATNCAMRMWQRKLAPISLPWAGGTPCRRRFVRRGLPNRSRRQSRSSRG
jgi:hypothetical protein